jgi:hypothetical protein
MEYDWSQIPVVANSSPMTQEMVRIANAKALHFAGLAYGASQVHLRISTCKQFKRTNVTPKD